MKRTSILVLALLLPFPSISQGIQFDQKLSMGKILEKAKTEQKYIFLDIYATWCGPCKMMDNNVYITDSVGKFFNQHMISVKVQMDKTTNDNERVRNWYRDAEILNEKYRITAYPTFLFLSPDGNLVHRASGFQSIENFLKIGTEAVDRSRNYEGLVNQFNSNCLSISGMRNLALKALNMEEKGFALKVARKYKELYLDSLSELHILTKKNIDFIREFPDMITTNDLYFKLLLTKPTLVDSFANQNGFAKRFRDFTITKEEITDKLWEVGIPKKIEPNWAEIEKQIEIKYTKNIARSILAKAKLRWYTDLKDWPNIVKYNIEYVETENPDLSSLVNRVMLNNMVFDVIFKHSKDPKQLKKGINWMKTLLSYEPDHYSWMDTQANLLYKLGEDKKAIGLEEMALEMATSKNDKRSIEIYGQIIEKMRSGEPTW